MADDIVTRLRTALDEIGVGCLGCSIINQNDHFPDCLTQQAADEIERLRKLVEHLSAQLRLQMKANDKAWEAYKEVVGDD